MKRRARSRLKKPHHLRSSGGGKSIFKSKTARVNCVIAVAGIVAPFHPATADFIKSHAAEILMGIGFVNLALRLITHDRVTLFSRAR